MSDQATINTACQKLMQDFVDAKAEIARLRGLLRAICQPESMKEYNGELRQWIDVGAFLEPGDALLFVTGDTLAAAREALGDAHQD